MHDVASISLRIFHEVEFGWQVQILAERPRRTSLSLINGEYVSLEMLLALCRVSELCGKASSFVLPHSHELTFICLDPQEQIQIRLIYIDRILSDVSYTSINDSIVMKSSDTFVFESLHIFRSGAISKHGLDYSCNITLIPFSLGCSGFMTPNSVSPHKCIHAVFSCELR